MELKDRGRALEDQFFQQEEARKLASLKEKKDKEATKAALRTSSGLDDDDVLERLVEIGISPNTLAAVSLVPLVVVAWADGTVDKREEEAILHGAKGKGIEEGSEAYALLSKWLTRKPGEELFEAWAGYIEALDQALTSEQLKILKRQVIDRARAVAESAGGYLFGTIGRVSTEEKDAIARLEAVFDRRAGKIDE
ncbi:MAG TPA: hypothetical protein VML75_26840 [Kofleriaceae bacterium]|nr:hypothetical protein [Kofleriaceae bacterium]